MWHQIKSLLDELPKAKWASETQWYSTWSVFLKCQPFKYQKFYHLLNRMQERLLADRGLVISVWEILDPPLKRYIINIDGSSKQFHGVTMQQTQTYIIWIIVFSNWLSTGLKRILYCDAIHPKGSNIRAFSWIYHVCNSGIFVQLLI